MQVFVYSYLFCILFESYLAATNILYVCMKLSLYVATQFKKFQISIILKQLVFHAKS